MNIKRGLLLIALLALAIVFYLYQNEIIAFFFVLLAGSFFPVDKIYAALIEILRPVLTEFLKSLFQKKEPPKPSISGHQDGFVNIIGESVRIGSIQYSGQFRQGLGAAFPPPLPEYYVKREDHIDDALKLLDKLPKDGRARQLVIAGIAGSGKTLLANAIVREVPETSRLDGIVWTRLGEDFISPDNAKSLLGEWLVRLGKEPRDFLSIQSRIEVVRTEISEKRMVFVFDDAWEAVPLKLLLSVIPDSCYAIVTTREPEMAAKLGVVTKIVTRGLAPKYAKTLVENRLGKVVSQDAWVQQIQPVIRKLAYHPLAISLASAQISLGDVTWEEIGRTISGNSKVLDFDDSIDQDGSLKRALSLSVNRLGAKASSRFLHMGVLAQGSPFTIVDVANILPDLPSSKLVKLEDTSVKELTPEDIAELTQEMRKYYRAGLLEASSPSEDFSFYWMHPLLHNYCKQALIETGQFTTAALLHGIHYFNVASDQQNSGGQLFDSPFLFPQIMLVLYRSYAFVTEKNQTALSKADSAYLKIYTDIFLHLVNLLSVSWSVLGNTVDALEWQKRAVQIADDFGEVPFLIQTLGHLAETYTYMGSFIEADKCYSRALDVALLHNRKSDLASVKNGLGILALSKDDPVNAVVLFTEALDLWEELNDPHLAAMARGNVGHALIFLNRFEEAIEKLELSVKQAEDSSSFYAYGKRFGNLGYAYLEYSRLLIKKSISMFQQSGDLSRGVSDWLSFAKQQIRLAEAHYMLGSHQVAEIYANQSIDLMSRMNFPGLEQLKLRFAQLRGEVADLPEPFSLQEMFAFTYYACMGDAAIEFKIRNFLKFGVLQTDLPENAVCVALLMVLDGERDPAKVVGNIDNEDAVVNLYLLILSLTQPEIHRFVLTLALLGKASISDDVSAAENLRRLAENMISQPSAFPLDPRELGRALILFLDGERDFAKLVLLVDDEISRIALRLITGGDLNKVIYGESLQSRINQVRDLEL